MPGPAWDSRSRLCGFVQPHGAGLAQRGCLGNAARPSLAPLLKALLTSDTALVNTHQTLTHLTVSALLLHALKCLPLILQPALFFCSPLEY